MDGRKNMGKIPKNGNVTPDLRRPMLSSKENSTPVSKEKCGKRKRTPSTSYPRESYGSTDESLLNFYDEFVKDESTQIIESTPKKSKIAPSLPVRMKIKTKPLVKKTEQSSSPESLNGSSKKQE